MGGIANYLQLPWRLQQPEDPFVSDGPSGLTGQGPLLDPAAMSVAPPDPTSTLPTNLAPPPQIPGGVRYDPDQMRLAQASAAMDMIPRPSPETMRLANEAPSTKRAILGGLAGAFKPTRGFAPLITYGAKGLAAREQAANYQKELPALMSGYESQARMSNLDDDNRRLWRTASLAADKTRLEMDTERQRTEAEKALARQRNATTLNVPPAMASRLGTAPGAEIPASVAEQGTRPPAATQLRSVTDQELAVIASGQFLDNPWKINSTGAKQALDLQKKAPAPHIETIEDEISGTTLLKGIDPQTGKELWATKPEQTRKRIPPSQTSGLSEDAVRQNAEIYRRTRQLPALGMGAGGDRQKILNMAALMGPIDIASNSADYRAASGALNALTRTKGLVFAFEDTANKNLDLALSVSPKVPRTGSPLVNRIAQAVQTNVWGDPALQQFHNAILTATNEYAKVITGATGGAAVTDAARREAQTLLSAAQNPEAFAGAVAIMKQEMANRRTGIDQEIQTLQSMVGGPKEPYDANLAPPANTPKSNAPANVPAGSVHVKRKADGGTGWISPERFDPQKYDRIP